MLFKYRDVNQKGLQSIYSEKEIYVTNIGNINFDISRPTNIFLFNSEEKLDIFRVNFLRGYSYGSSHTEYIYSDPRRYEEVSKVIKNKKFFHVWGRSGRGKTIFAIELSKHLLKNNIFKNIFYFFPKFLSLDNSNLWEQIKQLLGRLNDIKNDNSLLIIDDAHLINPNLVLSCFDEFKNNFSFFLVSRSKEKDSIPYEFINEISLYLDFNEIAEEYFKRIINEFCIKNNILFSDNIIDLLSEYCEGTNLVFLYHNLNAWKSCPEYLKKGTPSKATRNLSYTSFIEYYDKNLKDNWKEIQHIISALFQYEIKIDANYFKTQLFQNKDFENFEKEKVVYKKYISDKNIINKSFYVSYDFFPNEQNIAMLHAAEFRFYLNAYGTNLSFDDKRNFNRIEFTKLILEHYLLFEPANLPEVFTNLKWNSPQDEFFYIESYLLRNPQIRNIITKET